MLYKSTIFSEASGKLAGSVFSHNRSGQYVRAKGALVNPNTQLQVRVRSNMTAAGVGWRALSDTQRAEWQVYGDNVPVLSPLGVSTLLTGRQWYLGSRTARVNAGLLVVSDAPTTFDRGASGVESFTANADPAISITYGTSQGWQSSGGGLAVQVSEPQNGTVNYFKGPFKFLARVPFGDASPGDITAGLPTLAIGQALFIRVVALSSNGTYTAGEIFRTVVVAAP